MCELGVCDIDALRFRTHMIYAFLEQEDLLVDMRWKNARENGFLLFREPYQCDMHFLMS